VLTAEVGGEDGVLDAWPVPLAVFAAATGALVVVLATVAGALADGVLAVVTGALAGSILATAADVPVTAAEALVPLAAAVLAAAG
jgi:hypothetical protein